MAPVTSSFVLSPIAQLLLPADAVQKMGLTELPLDKSITSVELPEVQCSFPSQTIHPDYLQLKHLSQEWLLSRFGEMLLLDGAGQGGGFAQSVALKSRFDILVTLSYANGLSSRMPAIIKFMAWLHMVDNLLDEPQEMAADSSAAALLGARIMAVLEDRDDEESAAAVAASSTQLSARARLAIRLIEESAREVWSDLRSGMPVGQQQRFVSTFRDFLRATATQVGYRQSGRLADVEEYKRLRRDSSCWRACDVLIEFALGIELDEGTLAHPLLLRLRDATLYHICWLNDLLSFEKEYKDGDFFNLVSVLYYNRLKDSVDAAARTRSSTASAAPHDVLDVTPPDLHQILLDVSQLVKEMDEECVRLVRDIRSGSCDPPLHVSEELDAYIQSLTYWLGGNLSFHFAGMRHGLYTASYASKNLLARLPDALAHKLELSTCEAIVAATATPHLAHHLQLPAAQAA